MFSLDNTWPFRDKDAQPEGVPVRMVGVWADTVYTQAGQKPQRGFGGRIMFYEREEKDPIIVDGQLVIYAFDESKRDPTDNKPTRRYVFPADQMPVHKSKSELGTSYSFWLPWDEVGGPKTEISLICRFEPTAGGVISSEQTRHLLPGTTPTTSTAAARPKLQVPEGVPTRPPKETLEKMQSQRNEERQAKLTSYEAPAGAQPGAVINAAAVLTSPGRQMTATTIALPQNFQMPDLATVNAMQAASNPQATAQFPPQMTPNAGQIVLPATQTRTYTTGQQFTPSMAAANPYAGVQQPQVLPTTVVPMPPSTQPMGIAPPHLPMTTGHMAQPQQPMIGQPMMPTAQPQGMPQVSAPTFPTTAINYPAAGQLAPR